LFDIVKKKINIKSTVSHLPHQAFLTLAFHHSLANKVHTNTPRQLYTFVLFSSTFLSYAYWPSSGGVQEQKEKCYRRGPPLQEIC